VTFDPDRPDGLASVLGDAGTLKASSYRDAALACARELHPDAIALKFTSMVKDLLET
jgi:hypothetical protein